jgi:DNA-binding PadR family transcriptional regulator
MGERFINPPVVTKLMSLQNSYSEWLKRGKQRAAVARALRKPMTAVEICDAARSWAPRLQLRDVWFLMRQMAERGLALPLNERSNNGRLYALTDAGRRTVAAAFDVSVSPVSPSLDWRLYSWVVRARIRKRVLLGISQAQQRHPDGLTASSIRKLIRHDYPVGLNPVIRAVRELADKNLITCIGVTRLRSCKLYRLTPAGRLVVQQVLA